MSQSRGAAKSFRPELPEASSPMAVDDWSFAADHPDGYMAVSAVRDDSGALVDFRWLYANPAAETMMGMSLAFVLGRGIVELLPDARSRGIHSRFALVVETGQPYVDEVYFPLENHERWFRLVALKRGDGLSVWFNDITRRKREEREASFLAEASHLLTASLDVESALHELARRGVPAFADACVLQVMDSRGQPLLLETVATEPVQEALLVEVLRRSAEAPGGAPGEPGLLGLLLPQDVPQLLTELTPSLLQSLTRDPEHLRLMQALGPRSLVAVPLRARGRILGALVLFTFAPRSFGREDLRFAEDLADRVALSVDNALLFREARQAVAQRDEFFTVAAHELRTPTTSLKLNVQSLLRGARRAESGQPPAALMAKLENIDRNAGRLNALVNELLDVTRIHAGRLRLDLEPVDLAALVQDVAARFELPATQAHSPILLELSGSTVGSWDRLRLEQVVTNLLSNALKYGAGKPVRLKVSCDASGARLEVRDEGIGISPESLPRLFGRFERAVSDRHYGGLGLGLYITRQIVEALGGTVSVTSTPGAGATFTVQLPLEATH
ncbi:PAS domain S-box-containing protein [Archangium gephyra]|uniref:histidine kinase n=1 Tax=Archangium gephyra TaxID=48 RepID=A0AAC8TAU6_9BACT|nr:ATP-binding protein [Archangium gephyra]AKI99221.1 Sensory box histidine kinase [Archangium gephyra]REG31126.1 PAS domain S-box-containing protein [Archangium gephyra]